MDIIIKITFYTCEFEDGIWLTDMFCNPRYGIASKNFKREIRL